MSTILGMRVIVDESVPDKARMTVSPRLAELMPAQWVAETNAWMREFFGTDPQYFVLRNPATGEKTIVMNQRTFRHFERAAEEYRPPRITEYSTVGSPLVMRVAS